MRCDYVLNEGDGAFIPLRDRRVFMLQSGEKGTAQFRLIVHGQAGHASLPLRHGNAVLAAARVVEALLAHELPVVIDDSSRDSSSSSSTMQSCARVCVTRRWRARSRRPCGRATLSSPT